MKKYLIIFLVLAIASPSLLAGNYIRVNNNGMDADFTSLDVAAQAASSGDTIFIEGSATDYEGCTINKQLTIIGPGYFLGENPKTQAVGLTARFNNTFTLDKGAAGSTIIGCCFNMVYIHSGNTSIIRNNIYNIELKDTFENLLFIQNYVNGSIVAPYQTKLTQSIFSNNIISERIYFGQNCGGNIINNNTFITTSYSLPVDVFNSTIQNNIIKWEWANVWNTDRSNIISYNLFAISGTNANGNQYGLVMDDIFMGNSNTDGYSTDGRWKLKEGSPAIGAGNGGTDCGAFGSNAPYILSGIPNLPHIYEANVPAVVNSGEGMHITIKVKSGD